MGAVAILLWLVVAAGYLALPFLAMLVIALLCNFIAKKCQNAAEAKQKPVYIEQLKDLIPETRFFIDVQPLVKKEIHSVEQKVKIRSQIEATAKKHGLKVEKQSLSSMYHAGFNAIKEAQKAYILNLENGKVILFYLYLIGWDGHNGSKGIRGLINAGCWMHEITKAMNASGIAKISYRDRSAYNPYRDLTDEEKLLAIRAFDEGKIAYTQLKKSRQTLLPRYYYEWLINQDCETPKVIM
ncbi:MAG: hypothetical protein IJ461_04585 [Clostridia bacterium]|nr:hypothetical protein [Clostridia bacterium]